MKEICRIQFHTGSADAGLVAYGKPDAFFILSVYAHLIFSGIIIMPFVLEKYLFSAMVYKNPAIIMSGWVWDWRRKDERKQEKGQD